ncbi:type IV secretion system protein VirB5 [Fusobacterium necrophorum]|uniref:type IV secretion system protein n=1 Tax=Fusobacterium necrophorum TaxID=859 RepID=UPI000460F754|nr:type IV secretion system protein [Fusobacterium necrophorum]KDE71986.1 hypothetical protein FUSO7_09010 [Fusobacterium necrophorum BFTR-2]SDB16334.1 type IV secretion system protein VirB5 [Fusobacterium necrophorum]SQC98583.1 conjugal transfer protein TrbF [Fusobacterium necrophorum subsp. necrophorum]
MGFFRKKEKEKLKNKEKKESLDYEQAKEEYLNTILNVSKSRSNWVSVAILSLFITLLSILGVFYFGMRSTVIPYFFEIDRNGTVHKLTVGEYEKQYVPEEALITLTLKEFIENSRWISTDEVVQNNFVEKAFNYSSPKVIQKLKSIYAQEELTKLIKNGVTRDILIETVTKADETLYNARWTETIYNENGNIINQIGKFGNFNIQIIKPKNTAEMKKNPLGITIVDFNISTNTK